MDLKMKVRTRWVLVLLGALLAGCSAATPGAISTLAVTLAPTSAADAASTVGGGGVTASAEVVPAQWAQLSFAASGEVAGLTVREGQSVQTGDVLANLGDQAQLAAQLKASQEALGSAQKALDDLAASAPLTLAEAQQAVVNDQKRLDDAQKSLKQKDYHRCDQDTIDLYYSRLQDAEKALKDLKEDTGDRTTVHLQKIYDAESAYNTAQANYLYCIRYTDEEIAESNAEYNVAQASLAQSQARLERLIRTKGVDPSEEARLTAAISSAQAALEAAQLAVERAALKAPFGGTVVEVAVVRGQVVNAGQPVLTLADLSSLQVVTTDLSERDAPRVQVGQTARVTLAALGGRYTGKVVTVAQRATTIGGDVVYPVTIQLDELPAGLLWGMSATVEIDVP
jgi:multidrug efflux pump subunit AcrA (membrane-fusion protein)